ncbi:hypothetical protein GAYE_SCF03G2267 [Galdieria yellowstonensis]|uniref:Uncharacterized protein n=1 Tax=Galdieria yellowstonensis TaxID=3028027 RepID=A0AAV9IAH5_9RHOD|nr:hypothetical protein GAYE_SCF03G2267 [Galdieria yellowstonensis]
MRISKLIFTAAVLAVTGFSERDDWRLAILERVLFTLYMFCSLVVNYWLQRVVEKKRDASVIIISNPSSTEEVRTTVEEYDLSVLFRSRIVSIANGILIFFLLFKLHIHAPVVLLSSLGLFAIFQDPLFQIHVLGRPAEGSLARPFKRGQLFSLFD